MLYSGAALIGNLSQQQERLESLRSTTGVKPVGEPAKQGDNLDEDTRGALLRFARFIHKEKQDASSRERRKPLAEEAKEAGAKPTIQHPYKKAFSALTKSSDCGQILDTYV